MGANVLSNATGYFRTGTGAEKTVTSAAGEAIRISNVNDPERFSARTADVKPAKAVNS